MVAILRVVRRLRPPARRFRDIPGLRVSPILRPGRGGVVVPRRRGAPGRGRVRLQTVQGGAEDDDPDRGAVVRADLLRRLADYEEGRRARSCG